MKNIIGLIPSRLDSKRLKKKSLLKIDGLPMIVHTAKRAMLSKKLNEVIVCTDSKIIRDVCISYNIKSLLTKKNHINGTDRIAEVSNLIKSDLVVDIQGDEPFIDPNHIDRLIDFHIKNKHFDIVVPSLKLKNADNKNIVKIASNKKNQIIYLSRLPIPFFYGVKVRQYHKHLSIISFKRKTLQRFSQLKIGNLEKIEGIELLRALENNMKLGTFVLNGSSFAIDVKEDYLKAVSLMSFDKIRSKY